MMIVCLSFEAGIEATAWARTLRLNTSTSMPTSFSANFSYITHVLKPLLPTDTQHSYNLRDRSHNYSLINKDSHINDRLLLYRLNTLINFCRILFITIDIVKLLSVNFILNEYWIGLDWRWSCPPATLATSGSCPTRRRRAFWPRQNCKKPATTASPSLPAQVHVQCIPDRRRYHENPLPVIRSDWGTMRWNVSLPHTKLRFVL